jgi:hypothetical protein
VLKRRRRMAVKNMQKRIKVGDTTAENNKYSKAKSTLKQATKTQNGSKGIALLFLLPRR